MLKEKYIAAFLPNHVGINSPARTKERMHTLHKYAIINKNRQVSSMISESEQIMIPSFCQPYEKVSFPCYWLGQNTEFWQNDAADEAGLLEGNQVAMRRVLQSFWQQGSHGQQPQVLPVSGANVVYSLTLLPMPTGVLATAAAQALPPVSVLGSQLREPLTSIFSALPLLAKKVEDADAVYLEGIQKNCYHVLRLITNIECLQGLNKRPLKTDILNYGTLVDSIVSSAASVCKRGGVPIKADISPAHLLVKGNKYFISQAILNVLRNSLQYTRDNNQVYVKLRAHGNKALLTIEDKGMGIKPEHLEKVFEPYFSCDPYGSEAEGPGLGLGLAVVQKAMQAFGGNVTIESQFGGGTRVTMVLPLYNQPQGEAEVLSSDAIDYLLNRYSAVYVQLGGYCLAPDL